MSSEIDLGIEGLSGFRKIGAGGFADVYAAEDEFGRQVAVKVFKALDERGRRRFERERSAMGLVAGHPNIVTPYTSGGPSAMGSASSTRTSSPPTSS